MHDMYLTFLISEEQNHDYHTLDKANTESYTPWTHSSLMMYPPLCVLMLLLSALS